MKEMPIAMRLSPKAALARKIEFFKKNGQDKFYNPSTVLIYSA